MHLTRIVLNLVDDLIEPFRPFVDVLVYETIVLNNIDEFDLDIKKKLLSIFLEKCVIDGRVMTIPDAIHVCAESLIECLNQNSSAPLKLPKSIQGGR